MLENFRANDLNRHALPPDMRTVNLAQLWSYLASVRLPYRNNTHIINKTACNCT